MARTNQRTAPHLFLVVSCLIVGTTVTAGDGPARIAENPPVSAESAPQITPTPLTVEECMDLDLQYEAALQEARACHPQVALDQCSLPVLNSLICPCYTFVNSLNTPALKKMESASAAFDAAGCVGFWDCTGGFCPYPYPGGCQDATSPSKPGNNRGQCFDAGGW